MSFLTIAVTGHRPKDMGPAYGYGDPRPWEALELRIADEFEALARQAGADSVRVVTGGAQGADQVAFWAGELLRSRGLAVRSSLFVPFEGQSDPWRATGLFGQAAYDRMRATADDVVVVTTPRPDPRDRSAIVAALHRRNDAMVSVADVVVAVTSLDPARVGSAGGGTANAMRRCLSLGVPVRTVRP